ncbi:MAG: PBP1A family penicillin-binding protein [Acidimicrobiales bacterium]|nr:PBP1A family penicillin-binding protein [Acidimicrobiales bacterium]
MSRLMLAVRSRSCRVAACLLAVAVASGGCSYSSRSALPPTPISVESSTVFAADGTRIHTFHAEENRRTVPLEEVPLHVRDAVIAIEDERFYRHNGVDLRAIVRAVRENTESGQVAQGGSTITQQYVKKVLLRDESRTVERKLEEAATALQLERHYSKDRILELYLNAIYFGNGAYGIAAAAEQYFGQRTADLTLAEGALLAGLIQRPTGTDPYDEPDLAVARRDVVLERMVDNHLATEEAAAAARAEPLTLASGDVPAAERYEAAYFVEEVKQFILDDSRFGATAQDRRDLLFGGGLRIQTTVDLAAQRAAEASATRVLPTAGTDPDVALVSIEPSTGYVRAMVGGRDFFGPGAVSKLNLATQGPRPAGSSFKPLVLATALAEGMPTSTTYSAPACITIRLPNEVWNPCNYAESGVGGRVNLVEATVKSFNTAYAQLMMDVGPKDVVEAAADLGVRSPLGADPSLVLGTSPVTAMDMASVYATFANRGVRVPPVFVTRITRADGTVLFRHQHSQERALDEGVADTLTAILEQAVNRGTGTAARLDRPAAGKTGTGQEWRDAWFAGFTPELATVVWVGFHEGQIDMEPPRTPIRVTGGSYPAQIWKGFMSAALAGRPVTPFAPPPPETGITPDTSVTTTTSRDREDEEDPDDPFGTIPDDGPHNTGRLIPDSPTPSRGRQTTTTTTTRPPPNRAPPGPRIVEVPAVIGRTAESATATLRAAGFVVSRRPAAGDYKPGTVVTQSPPGGSLAPQGSTVVIGVVGG